jgi:hypothetical protein
MFGSLSRRSTVAVAEPRTNLFVPFVLTGRRIKGMSVQAVSDTLQTIDGMQLQAKQQPVLLSAHLTRLSLSNRHRLSDAPLPPPRAGEQV